MSYYVLYTGNGGDDDYFVVSQTDGSIVHKCGDVDVAASVAANLIKASFSPVVGTINPQISVTVDRAGDSVSINVSIPCSMFDKSKNDM